MSNESLTYTNADIRDFLDALYLCIDEISIFNNCVLDRVQWLCSLDQNAKEDLKVNAYSLIQSQPKLNLFSLKILENVIKINELMEALMSTAQVPTEDCGGDHNYD